MSSSFLSYLTVHQLLKHKIPGPALCYTLLLCSILLYLTGCQPDQEVVDPNPASALTFTQDTVLFDTVFTERGSITKRVYLKNPNPNAVEINEISLAGGNASPYTITVKGIEADRFEEELLLGEDSLLILVEVEIDPANSDMPFLVADSIIATLNGRSSQTKLVAWGQDANYLGGVVLGCDTRWTAERPYVLTGTVLIDTLCTLTVEPGAKIYSTFDGLLAVAGKIEARGSDTEPILFANDRFEEDRINAPGQWRGIFILEGSSSNEFHWTTIRNAEVGIRIGTPDQDTLPDLTLQEVKIENISGTGLLAFSADVVATNLLINNCRQHNLGVFIGGHYRFKHCTFASYNFDFFREDPGVLISDNFITADNQLLSDDTDIELLNCIIDGSLRNELLFAATGGVDFLADVRNNLIKTEQEDLADLGNLLNEDPLFIDASMYDYRLDTLSPVVDLGLDLGVVNDLDNQPRDAQPDLGAYERIE